MRLKQENRVFSKSLRSQKNRFPSLHLNITGSIITFSLESLQNKLDCTCARTNLRYKLTRWTGIPSLKMIYDNGLSKTQSPLPSLRILREKNLLNVSSQTT